MGHYSEHPDWTADLSARYLCSLEGKVVQTSFFYSFKFHVI